jgi:glyoxylase-like metal-dependent hydrolase (beta-lactamase superfamily II)
MGLSVGDDAVFLIDDQYAPLSGKILAAISAITPKPVRFILNTHWHGDHTGGNENFASGGTLVVAHENVRKRMGTEQFLEVMGGKVPPSPAAALPLVTFVGAMTFHLNGDEIRAIHVPNAHTDGDAIVHLLKADVFHMGDVYWNGLYPFIDSASGGSVEGTIAAVDRILALATEKTRVIAGHGPAVSGRKELQEYRDMLATISGRVKALAAQGRKVEEIVAANPSAEFDETWGKTYIKGPKFVEGLAKDALRR